MLNDRDMMETGMQSSSASVGSQDGEGQDCRYLRQLAPFTAAHHRGGVIRMPRMA